MSAVPKNLPEWEMATGDVNSKEMGTGARANGDKPMWELMSLSQVYMIMADAENIELMAENINDADMIAHTAGFQRGITQGIDLLKASVAYNWAKQGGRKNINLLSSLENVIEVWKFGLRKYSEYNWATGMNWQIPIACIVRHVKYHFENDVFDDESEELHSAHVVCNAMMLVHYEEFWEQGDDRPLFAFPQKEESESDPEKSETPKPNLRDRAINRMIDSLC